MPTTPELLLDQQPQPQASSSLSSPQKPKNNNKRKRSQLPDPPSIQEYWNPDSSSSSSHHLPIDITISEPSPSPSQSSSSSPPCTAVAELLPSSSSSAVLVSERSVRVKKLKRGEATLKNWEERRRRNGGRPLDVGLNEKGKPEKSVGSVIGLLVRAHAPVWRDTWEDVDKGVKQHLKDDLKKFFVLDYTNPTVLGYVDESMKQAYRDFKSLLKKEYNCAGSHDEGRKKLPKASLWNYRPLSHWHWLCDNMFREPTRIEISKINSENRKSNGVAKGSKNDGPSRQSIISAHENKIRSLESVIEELRAEIEALKANGEALKAKNDDLEKENCELKAPIVRRSREGRSFA